MMAPIGRHHAPHSEAWCLEVLAEAAAIEDGHAAHNTRMVAQCETEGVKEMFREFVLRAQYRASVLRAQAHAIQGRDGDRRLHGDPVGDLALLVMMAAAEGGT